MSHLQHLMMNCEREVWSAVKILIQEYGECASAQAAKRAGHLLNEGNLGGALVWQRITKATEEMLREKPNEDEAIH